MPKMQIVVRLPKGDLDKAETFISKSIYCPVKSPVLCVEFKQNLGLPRQKL